MAFSGDPVSLECPDCEEIFVGLPQVAGKERTRHRIEKHGFVRPGRAAKNDAPPRDRGEPRAVSVASVVSDAGRPSGAASTAPPRRAEWEKKLGATIGLYSVWRVTRAINGSRLPEDEQDDALASLAFNAEEEQAVASPFAGVIADGPLKDLNKKYGRNALDLLDSVPAMVALMSFEQRMRRFQRDYGQPRQRRGRDQNDEEHRNGARPFPSFDEASQASGFGEFTVAGVVPDSN